MIQEKAQISMNLPVFKTRIVSHPTKMSNNDSNDQSNVPRSRKEIERENRIRRLNARTAVRAMDNGVEPERALTVAMDDEVVPEIPQNPLRPRRRAQTVAMDDEVVPEIPQNPRRPQTRAQTVAMDDEVVPERPRRRAQTVAKGDEVVPKRPRRRAPSMRAIAEDRAIGDLPREGEDERSFYLRKIPATEARVASLQAEVDAMEDSEMSSGDRAQLREDLYYAQEALKTFKECLAEIDRRAQIQRDCEQRVRDRAERHRLDAEKAERERAERIAQLERGRLARLERDRQAQARLDERLRLSQADLNERLSQGQADLGLRRSQADLNERLSQGQADLEERQNLIPAQVEGRAYEGQLLRQFVAAPRNAPRRLLVSKWSSDSPVQCVICLENYERNNEIAELPCGHWFHLKCINEWLETNRTCPVCRAAV